MAKLIKANILMCLFASVMLLEGIYNFPTASLNRNADFTNSLNQLKNLFSNVFQSKQLGISDCEGCKVLFTVLGDLVHSNNTDLENEDEVTALCTSLGIETEQVCYYAVHNIMPDVVYVFKAVENNMTIDNICEFLVGGSCIVMDDFLPVFDWNVTFPSPAPPYVPVPQPDPTSPKIRILHMSDTHFDEQYLEGTVSNCNEPICCRANKVSEKSEVHYGGKYGGVNGSCDIPIITLESMLQFAANNVEFDLVYWTGDIPPHDIWNQTHDSNIHMLQVTSSLVKQYFAADNVVFASVGNHEAQPVNIFPVPAAYDDYPISYLYTQLDSVWSSFIPAIDHTTILKGGYFAFDVFSGLRIISLNMNYCNDENVFLLIESQDPTEELQWLIGQLDDAEKNNIKVHILGHIPNGQCVYVWSRNYRDILERYRGVIAGHFYGHTHNDEFEMVYDDEDTSTPISVAQIAPSVTTYSHMNPAFRVYTVDGNYQGSTFQVLDYEEYWLDIDRANADGFPTWELLFDAKESYGLPDFTENSYEDFLTRMTVNDALFQTFYQNYNRVFNDEPCDLDCKQGLLCNLRKGWAGYKDKECAR